MPPPKPIAGKSWSGFVTHQAALRLLLALGVLMLVPGAIFFFTLVMRGTDSLLVYVAAATMYVGMGITLYATVVLWTED
jgi:hypothetical protein